MAANTILDGMQALGLDPNVQPALGTSPAMRVATEVFSNNFLSCMNITDEQIDSAMKAFAHLTIAQGRVIVMPGAIKRLKAYTQFVCHHLRMGVDPATVPFNLEDEIHYIQQRADQKKFEKDSSDLASDAKPKPFVVGVKWIDWEKTLYNYLKLIPSQQGIPLAYIIRENDAQDFTPRASFLEMYIYAAPLTGQAYQEDNAKVYTLLKKFVEGHVEAEMLVNVHEATSDGRAATKSLKVKYEGIGINSTTRKEALHDIEEMFYNGDKPNMTWEIFETRLTAAYINYDKIEGRTLANTAHSDVYRLDKLLMNVRADSLKSVKASIAVEMSKATTANPYTFSNALDAFRFAVQNSRPQKGAMLTSRRNVNETASDRRSNKGKNSGRGNKNDKRHGMFASCNQVKKGKPDSKIVKLKNGKWIDYHPSYLFPCETKKEFPEWLDKKLTQQRDAYKKRKAEEQGNRGGNRRAIEEMSQRLDNISRQLGQVTNVPGQIAVDAGSTITTERERNEPSDSARRSIMGGRNEQEDLRRRRNP